MWSHAPAVLFGPMLLLLLFMMRPFTIVHQCCCVWCGACAAKPPPALAQFALLFALPSSACQCPFEAHMKRVWTAWCKFAAADFGVAVYVMLVALCGHPCLG